MLAECGFKDGPHPLRVGLLHRLAAQKITAPGIGDGQRIDAPSVAALEPALEIGAPDAVRLHRMRQRLRIGFGAATLPARHNQPGTLDDLAHGAGRRPPPPRLIPLQNALQLARTPRICASRSSSTARSTSPAVWLGCCFADRFSSIRPFTPCNGNDEATHNRCPGISQTGHTAPSSTALRADVQRQSAASLP